MAARVGIPDALRLKAWGTQLANWRGPGKPLLRGQARRHPAALDAGDGTDFR